MPCVSLHQKQKTATRRSFVFAVAAYVRTPLKCRLRHLKSFAPQHSSKSAESRAQSGGYESPGKPPPGGLLFLLLQLMFEPLSNAACGI